MKEMIMNLKEFNDFLKGLIGKKVDKIYFAPEQTGGEEKYDGFVLKEYETVLGERWGNDYVLFKLNFEHNEEEGEILLAVKLELSVELGNKQYAAGNIRVIEHTNGNISIFPDFVLIPFDKRG